MPTGEPPRRRTAPLQVTPAAMPPPHNAPTGEVTTVTLASSVESVAWTAAEAAPGGEVGLEVQTRFVGRGARLDVTLTDGDGARFGPFSDTLWSDRFRTRIAVPPDATGVLVAEAKLPRRGVQATSPPLLLAPRVQVADAKWSASEARRGDVLTLTASARGAADGTPARLSIWEHDADGAHDPITEISAEVAGEQVEAEWAYEYHEDTDGIATAEEAERGYHPPEYFFRCDVLGVTAESGLLTFKDYLDVALADESGAPSPDQRVVAVLADGSRQEARTDADGRARFEGLPPGPVHLEVEGVAGVEPA